MTKAQEERAYLLALYKKRNMVVLLFFLLATLAYAGVMIGVLAYDAKQAGVPFSIDHMGPMAYILLIAAIVLVAFSLVRLVSFLVKTATEQGLVESYVEAKVKKMPVNKQFAMLDAEEEYEDKKITEEEYREKIENILKPVAIIKKI